MEFVTGQQQDAEAQLAASNSALEEAKSTLEACRAELAGKEDRLALLEGRTGV